MIGVEIRKLVRRPRTWVSIFLLCLLPAVIAVFLATSDRIPGPGEGPELLGAVLSNGSLYPAAALALVLPILLPVAVAVVAGDSIAGEAQAGTLRYLLVRPAGRTRLLVAKLVAVVAFDLLAVVAVAATSYVVGTSLLGRSTVGGTDGAITLSGTPLGAADILERTALTLGYVTWSMLSVAAIAIFLSTLADSPLGASFGALAVLVLSQALVTLEAAAALRPYLPTRYWFAWRDFFRDPILWHDVQRGFAVQAVYVVVFLGLAWANFATKDVKT